MAPGAVGPALAVQRADGGPEDLLEAPPEVLIEVAVDDGVGAAVEEGQPVGERVDVDSEQVELALTQPPIVRQQHQCPEGQPGDSEEEGDDDEHVDDLGLPPGDPPPLWLLSTVGRGHRLEELEGDAGIHDDNEGEGSHVDVGEEDGGVDPPHLCLRPGLPTGIEGVGVVVGVHHEVVLLPGDSQGDGSRAHDEQGQHPDDGNGQQGFPQRQLLPEGVDDAAKPVGEQLVVALGTWWGHPWGRRAARAQGWEWRVRWVALYTCLLVTEIGWCFQPSGEGHLAGTTHGQLCGPPGEL